MGRKLGVYFLLQILPFMIGGIVVVSFFGGGASTTTPVLPVATEDTIEGYATIASELGVPWEIVILTDTMLAEHQHQTSIENCSPIATSLEFLSLTIKEEQYVILNAEEVHQNPEIEPIYGWVEQSIKTYQAKQEILNLLGLAEEPIEALTPSRLKERLQQFTEENSNEQTRLTADLKLNTNFKLILTQTFKLDEAISQQILDLYQSDYLESWLSEEALVRVNEIKAENGLYQYVESDGESNSYEGIIFADGVTPVVYYNQLDSRWSNLPYGSDNIGGYGCGPTSMAIVISTLTGATYDPVYMANWSYQNGFWAKGSGSYHSLIPEASKSFGLSVSGASVSEGQRIVDALSQGKLVVAIMGKGHFTTSGHFMVLRGVTSDGKILVADPASQKRSQMTWDLSIILNEARKVASAGGPFWIIG